ncbi:MAG: MFS transporter, partial [Alistipes shahii]|nr:MFS transporter [Alistipes shahii]
AAAVLGTILAMIVVPMITRAGWAPFFIFGGLLFPVSLLAVFLFGGRIQNIDEEKQQ